MKRRTFVYTGIALVALLGLGDFFLLNYESKWKKRTFLYPLILSAFLDEEWLRIIGNTYRSMRPDNNSENTLLNSIRSQIPSMHDNMNGLNEALEIEKIVESDFKSER